MILMITFSLITFTTISSFALFAGLLNHKIKNYKSRKRLNKFGGASLIASGLLTSAMQKN